MMYTRAQRDDFDSWNTPGWSTDELIPFLRKLETYDGPGDPSLHGTSGPVRVSSGPFRSVETEDDFLRAAAATGCREVKDLQDLDRNDGWQRWWRYVSPEGVRSDTAHAYVHPRLRDGKHPNLHVVVEAQVVRVLFEDDGDAKRASAVEYAPNPKFNPDATGRERRTVRARKLVVVSCGACGTPPVLERSGIGAAPVLERAGVPLVQDLPGVGYDYQDHHLTLYPFRTSMRPDQTIDDVILGRVSLEAARERKEPRLGWNSIDMAAKLRPTEEETLGLGETFRAAWVKDYKDKPNRPLFIMAMIQVYIGPPALADEPIQYITMGNCTAYPYSRGHLHITGPSPNDPLDFDVGYFGDPGEVDITKQVWAYKKMREIVRRMSTYRGEVPGCHPQFAADSAAACVRLEIGDANPFTTGEKGAVADIAYTEEDDAAIRQWLRETVQTTWHSLGTAKMAPRGDLGVVDADLSVHGVRGLKVADMSIAPANIGSNTNNTAILIGEKAADIIIRELGLGGAK
ncbi:GMC oxidoreductase-domain-containing protein [Camillea tinctor]|nr:GMC oxidoreductase-domain-containing protein [Camillea tinctor]